MNKHYTLVALHVIFWLALVLLAFFDLTITLFGRYFPIEGVLTVFFLPILVVLSWRADKNARTRLLSNYYSSFRWFGLGFWVFSIFLVWVSFQS